MVRTSQNETPEINSTGLLGTPLGDSLTHLNMQPCTQDSSPSTAQHSPKAKIQTQNPEHIGEL